MKIIFRKLKNTFQPVVYFKNKPALIGSRLFCFFFDNKKEIVPINDISEKRIESELNLRKGVKLIGKSKNFDLVARVFERNEILNWDVEVRYIGRKEIDASFQVRFDVNDTGVPRWMIPGLFYRENRVKNCKRIYPRYDSNRVNEKLFVSNYWHFRSDRCALPSVFCWTDNMMSVVATDERFSNGQSGVGFFSDGKKTSLYLSFPYREEPVKYVFFKEDKNAPEVKKMKLKYGDRLKFQFQVFVSGSNLHNYNKFLRKTYGETSLEYGQKTKKIKPTFEFNPFMYANPWMTTERAANLLSYGLYHWFYDKGKKVLYETASFDKYFALQENATGYEDRKNMHIAWVSGIPYAYFLLRFGIENGIEDYYKAGVSVINKICNEGLSPCGAFYSQWTSENGWDTGWNPNKNWIQSRTTAEANLFLLKALFYINKNKFDYKDAEVKSWEKAIKSNLDFALSVQKRNGSFGSYYNIKTGKMEVEIGAGGLVWIPALILGARYFRKKEYLDAAIKGGEFYKKYVDDEFIYGAPEDVHLTPTSEDAYNALIAFLSLYEETKNKEFINYAKKSADYMMTFRWFYNTKFSLNTFLGKYDFRTMGGDIASPANQHLHNYGLICLPELLKLWEITKDDYYLMRARDNLYFSLQTIAREDGDLNARKGMITEQWYHTDWWQPKGAMLQLAHCWCAGLVLYAHQTLKEFGQIILNIKNKKYFALEPLYIIATEKKDSTELTIANPFDYKVDTIVRLIENLQKKKLTIIKGDRKSIKRINQNVYNLKIDKKRYVTIKF